MNEFIKAFEFRTLRFSESNNAKECPSNLSRPLKHVTQRNPSWSTLTEVRLLDIRPCSDVHCFKTRDSIGVFGCIDFMSRLLPITVELNHINMKMNTPEILYFPCLIIQKITMTFFHIYSFLLPLILMARNM